MREWILVNAEERAKENPANFEMPPKEARMGLKPRTLVKLIFQFKDADSNNKEIEAERMWVEIIENNGDDYLGTLDNDPEVIKRLKSGDKIEFKPENIIAIWED